MENSSLIGAVCLHLTAALEHRWRRSDAPASRHSSKQLLQVKPNKEVLSFLRSHQNIKRRAARRADVHSMAPVGPTAEKGIFSHGERRAQWEGVRGIGFSPVGCRTQNRGRGLLPDPHGTDRLDVPNACGSDIRRSKEGSRRGGHEPCFSTPRPHHRLQGQLVSWVEPRPFWLATASARDGHP